MGKYILIWRLNDVKDGVSNQQGVSYFQILWREKKVEKEE